MRAHFRLLMFTLSLVALLATSVPAAVATPSEATAPGPQDAVPGLTVGGAQHAGVVEAQAASTAAKVAVKTALAQVGKPYKWGGSGPNSYDCSGLTSYAWEAAGVSLPHNSRMQYNATTRVSADDLRPGDLLFFYRPVSHVGMYIGNGKMIDAPYSGRSVRVRSATGYHSIGRPR